MYYAKEVVEDLQDSKEIVIYGARIVAKEAANCLMGEPYNLKISSFMVSDKAGNPAQIMGIPVIDISEGEKKYKDAAILVAVMEKYQDEILESLRSKGFYHVISLTFESDLWSELRGNFYRELRIGQGKEYLTLEEELNSADTPEDADLREIKIYAAKCHVDRPLCEDTSKYGWEVPIQVGAALTDQRIARVCDNAGENISHKNKEYCELTALYWIWKNDRSKYAGLCHYRRHFELDEDSLKKLMHSDIDVVLTIPILNFPNVRAAYCNDHMESDWNIMLEAIKELQPEYSKTADELQRGNFYYGYNMLIARKEVLDAYCAWVFPILEYCEKKCGKKEDTYQNRYIGFLAERLLSIYFLHNEKKYKIVHARKHFIRDKKQKKLVIYGAQMVAVSVYFALKQLYPETQVAAFLVRNLTGNPKEIDGIPVMTFAEFSEKDAKVLIATPENYHPAIAAELEKRGFRNYLCMDAKKEAALMERYYQSTGEFQTLHSLKKGKTKAEVSVYMSKFVKDQPLKCPYKLPEWVHPIQAGAALTKERIADIADDTGENISVKNVNYSELSAMYWIGKHAGSEYLGLFHYRRILDVQEEDFYRLQENDIDVVLPYPTIQEPDITAHNKRYLKETDWQAMRKALRECAPEYAEALPLIFAGRYFYNYNMFLAKERVFKDYCNWLFPILKRTEELSVPKGSERADRYIGYLGENLTTLYFMYHKNDLRIAHTGRLMLT